MQPHAPGEWTIDWRDDNGRYRLLVSPVGSYGDMARFCVYEWDSTMADPGAPDGIDWDEVARLRPELLIDGAWDARDGLTFDVVTRKAGNSADAHRIGDALSRVYDAVRALMWSPRVAV